MNYQEAWTYLDNLQFFKIKLGLESMTEFLRDVGRPQEKLKFIHIGGTNGKGSVAAMLHGVLAIHGYKVGIYTSPHLSSVRERFRINDAYISEDEFADIATRIRHILDGRKITYFEFTTAIAMMWFAEQNVDLAILEVGMGGRLDATNVVIPLVSIITNVSMDHEAYLGNTLAEIAFEKAGIIKPGVPVVCGSDDEVSKKVIEQTCSERKAPLFLLGRDFFLDSNRTKRYHGLPGKLFQHFDFDLSIKGGHQGKNAALALAVLELLSEQGFTIDSEKTRNGLNEVRWPGRQEEFYMEIVSEGDNWAWTLVKIDDNDIRQKENVRRILLDGAHNPAGIASLKEALEHNYTYAKMILIWASMGDKDIASTLRHIAPLADNIVFTMPERERSATPEKLREVLPEDFRKRSSSARDVKKAIAMAFENSTSNDLICIAGSLYLIGAARKILLGELVP